MPRYVLLYHQCPPAYERPSHWDLMLETSGVLETWALRQLPHDWQAAHVATVAVDSDCRPVARTNSVQAERLGKHRTDFLDWEGELSGNRGRVCRLLSGRYDHLSLSPGDWEVALTGDLVGKLTLHHTAPGQPEWSLVYEPID
jgi:hypothetical protein